LNFEFRAHREPTAGGRGERSPRLQRKKPLPRLNQGMHMAALRRLPKRMMPYIDPPPWGHVAEWLRNGLQNRVHQFNSGRGLHLNH
jgi:hypothetical protein